MVVLASGGGDRTLGEERAFPSPPGRPAPEPRAGPSARPDPLTARLAVTFFGEAPAPERVQDLVHRSLPTLQAAEGLSAEMVLPGSGQYPQPGPPAAPHPTLTPETFCVPAAPSEPGPLQGSSAGVAWPPQGPGVPKEGSPPGPAFLLSAQAPRVLRLSLAPPCPATPWLCSP